MSQKYIDKTDTENSQNKKIEEEELSFKYFKEFVKILQNLPTYVLTSLGKCHLFFPFAPV